MLGVEVGGEHELMLHTLHSSGVVSTACSVITFLCVRVCEDGGMLTATL